MSKKYNIIYADPPWSYSDKRGADKVGAKHGGVNAHYGTMTAQGIKDLDVQSVTADNCMLFMWVTFPNLQQGLDTIKAWGFKYKTLGFSWIKTNKKMESHFSVLGGTPKAIAKFV